MVKYKDVPDYYFKKALALEKLGKYEEAGKIWDSIGPKIDKLVEDSGAIDSKERKQTDKEILVLDALTYCFVTRAFDLWTPKFWRSDAIAAKIREMDQARVEKEKAKAEKRVPVGGETN